MYSVINSLIFISDLSISFIDFTLIFAKASSIVSNIFSFLSKNSLIIFILSSTFSFSHSIFAILELIFISHSPNM